VLCRRLLHSRIGYFWLAIREDQEAAQAVGIDVFRAKLAAVLISAAMTSLGGVFYAFFYNNLFPEQIFSVSRSIELILAPVIGGIGTLFGPIFGAFILTPLAELVTWAIESAGLNMPGIKQIFYGLALVLIVVYRPDGVWPWVARYLKLVRQSGDRP
jgi:branched-chain amino acid transport system permease protein